MIHRFLTALFFLAAVSPLEAATDAQARDVFARYQTLERAFDPAIADLYCDSALIRNVRTYPTGEKRAMEFPAPRYKALIRSAMPIAKARADYSTYSVVRYAAEGDAVRITATRFSNAKKYASPISILVGDCPGVGVAILEELSQSIP